jgi:hypothetical protein
MRTPLIDDEGENRAVRSFLLYYGGNTGITVGNMRQHLEMCGYPFWPSWCQDANVSREHLTKAGAQLWLRHLFDLEKTADKASA